MTGVLRRILRSHVEKTVGETIMKVLDDRIPFLIEEILAERFKTRPNDPLSEVGFNWALALSLRLFWPDVSNAEAVRWLREYIEVPYGTAGHDWTASAAKLVASEYVNENGEVA